MIGKHALGTARVLQMVRDADLSSVCPLVLLHMCLLGPLLFPLSLIPRNTSIMQLRHLLDCSPRR